MLVMFLGPERGLDAGGDVIVVAHGRAVLIEYLDDRHVSVDGKDGLALLLELLLIAEDVGPAWCPGIHSLGRQPAEPEADFPPVICFGCGESIQERYPLINDFCQCLCCSHKTYLKRTRLIIREGISDL